MALVLDPQLVTLRRAGTARTHMPVSQVRRRCMDLCRLPSNASCRLVNWENALRSTPDHRYTTAVGCIWLRAPMTPHSEINISAGQALFARLSGRRGIRTQEDASTPQWFS